MQKAPPVELRDFIDARVDAMGRCPRAFNLTREAYCSTLSLLLELAGATWKVEYVPLYQHVFKFVGARGGAPVDPALLREEVSDEWAREVVAWVKTQLVELRAKP